MGALPIVCHILWSCRESAEIPGDPPGIQTQYTSYDPITGPLDLRGVEASLYTAAQASDLS